MAGHDSTTTSSGARQDAQRRADQISAFGRELAELERDGVVTLRPEDRVRIERHHADLLATLARQFDVDRTDSQRQMTLGMRVASLIGAVTLSAGIVLFFYRFWGLMTTPLQVAVLAATPIVALWAVELAARRDPTRYIAAVLSIIAAAAFALNLGVVGASFDMTPSPHILIAWAAFALALAYAYGLRILLAAGLAAAMGYGVGLTAQATGLDWAILLQRPEPLIPLGAAAFLLSFWRPAIRPEGFDRVWRLMGTAALLLPLVFLATGTEAFSYQPLPLVVLHAVYDVLGFGLPVVAIWFGIRRRWTEVANAASAFLVLFVYAKCFDWWWSLLPRYLFFLLLGGLAMGAMALLARLRLRMRGGVR
jgi:uncharacterized membrane protein